MDVINRAKEWGADLIGNFIQGIKAKAGELWDTVKGIAGGVADFLGFSEPRLGPLSSFHEFAPDMMALFAQGIRDNAHLVTDAIGDSYDLEPVIRLAATGSPRSGFVSGSGTGAQAGTLGRGQTPQVLSIVLELDKQQLGRAVYRLNEEETQRVGLKLAGGYA